MGTIFRNIVFILVVIALVVVSYVSYSSLYTEKIVANGIFGKVLLGPAEPYFGGQISGGNYVPYAATIAVLSEDGSTEILTFTSDATGSFKVALDPGTYLLEPAPGGELFPRAEPLTVEVFEGRLTQVDILYDTGVR